MFLSSLLFYQIRGVREKKMNSLDQLLTICMKNLKIVFRSWTSTFLLILGPLLLILVVGYAFGGEGLHDISIGYYAKHVDAAQEIITSLQDEQTTMVAYGDLDSCLSALKNDRIHICIGFSDDFQLKKIKEKQTSQGTVIFYYNNARFNLIAHLTKMLDEKLAVKTEQITLEATTSILQDISATVDYMQDVRSKMSEFRDSAVKARLQLIQTKADLELINDDFQKYYSDYQTYSPEARKAAKEFDAQFDNVSLTTTQSLVALNTTISSLGKLNTALQAYIFVSGNTGNVKLGNVTLNMTPFLEQSVILQSNLLTIQTNLQSQQKSLLTIKDATDKFSATLDNISKTLDLMDHFLKRSLIETQDNINKLDVLLNQIDELLVQLDKNIDKFTVLTKTSAGSIVKPISTQFVAVLQDISKISLVFPVMLVFVICFIAILLSNMNVIQEITSPAYFRTFLLPVNSFTFLFALFLTIMAVVSVQVSVLLIIAYSKFNIQIFTHFSSFFFVVLLFMSLFVLMGMIIGYFVKNRQVSVIVSTFIALIFFLFSDVIFPLESMPKLATFLANLNPLVIGERIFRKLLYFDIGLGQQMGDVITLIVYIVIFVILLIVAYNYNKKKT